MVFLFLFVCFCFQDDIPEHMSVAKLLKDLSRELRHAERNANLTPASSGAASLKASAATKKVAVKRVRKKPHARADFVDINEALSNFAAEEVICPPLPLLAPIELFLLNDFGSSLSLPIQ